MRFEYNADLFSDDFLEFVSNEIVDRYPLISTEEAKDIAVFTPSVDDKVSNDDKFYRCYLIMKCIGINHEEFEHVFNDAYHYYDMGLTNDRYISTMENIIDYVSGNSSEFPDII